MTLPQPLSHPAALPEWLTQPLSHSATLSDWVAAPATLAERLSSWVAGVKISAIARSICLSSICLPARAQLGKTSFKTNLDRSNMQRFGETSELKNRNSKTKTFTWASSMLINRFQNWKRSVLATIFLTRKVGRRIYGIVTTCFILVWFTFSTGNLVFSPHSQLKPFNKNCVSRLNAKRKTCLMLLAPQKRTKYAEIKTHTPTSQRVSIHFSCFMILKPNVFILCKHFTILFSWNYIKPHVFSRCKHVTF